MRPLKGVRRLRHWFRRSRLDDELRDEVELHVELRRRALEASGMDPREAAYEARRMFGNVTAIREETRAMWGFPVLETIVQDVRFGARLLRRSPLFTAVAVLSLAVGIGASVAVFDVADAVLFRPMAVRAPQELRAFRAVLGLGGGNKIMSGVDPAALAELQRGADFAEFIGFRTVDDVTVGGEPGVVSRVTRLEFVSGNYFSVLGLSPSAGRLLDGSDDRSLPVPIVLSERLWRTAFHNDPGVAGRTVSLNGRAAVVTGVVREFRGFVADSPADVFAPLTAGSVIDPESASRVPRVVARLRPGVGTAVAEQKFTALYLGSGSSMARTGELRVTLLDARLGVSEARGPLERPLWLGLGLAGVLLLVASANTAGLLLARYASRRGEFGVRIAIGAGRGRLIRQLVIEALLVALMAAAAGLMFGWLAAPLLVRSIPAAAAPPAFELRLDWRLLMFTAAISVAAACGAAAASLFRLMRSDPAGLLGGDTRAIVPGSSRMTAGLIGAQVACSLLLLVGAVSLTRTLINLNAVSPGFDPDGTFAVTVSTAGRVPDPEASRRFFAALHERISAAPNVASATLAQMGLMTAASTTGTVTVPGFSSTGGDDRWIRLFFVGPGYFETLGMPIVLGRSLTRQDLGGRERVAVVNKRFAQFYFGATGNALGRVVNGDVHIVGVAADAHYDTLRDEPARVMFIPYTQAPPRAAMTFIVRAAGDPGLAIRSVREAVSAFDAQLRPRITTGADQVSTTLARERFVATLSMVLSGLALFLASAGLYAAVSYAVWQRRGELAVRLALGATRIDILRLVLTDPLRTTAIGIAAGIPGAYLLMRAASSLLFGVSPFDPATVALAGAMLLAIAAAAAIVPARRAVNIDPVSALRQG